MDKTATKVGSLIAAGAIVLATDIAQATTYGIYDARTLALGGAAVAFAESDNAMFYNGALLAFYDEIEEKTLDGRFQFPLLIAQVTDAALDGAEFVNDDPDDVLSAAVATFNASPIQANAQSVANAAANLDASFSDIAADDLVTDAYFGLAVSEPSKFQGAGYFLGARVVAGGRSNITDADRALLNAYVEGMTFIATNGAQGAPRPDLFDADGSLRDPNDDFTSSANGRGAIISEIGMALSRRFQIGERSFALGISPKAQRIDTFEDARRVVDSTNFDRVGHETINFDIGAAIDLSPRLRIGVASKDVLPRSYGTAAGNTVKLRPRSRAGVAYLRGSLRFAFDLDLYRNQPVGTEAVTQEAALGAEWTVSSSVRLRGGYRHDIAGNRDGIFSLGSGFSWRRALFDLAFAANGDFKAGALQFGYAF